MQIRTVTLLEIGINMFNIMYPYLFTSGTKVKSLINIVIIARSKSFRFVLHELYGILRIYTSSLESNTIYF